jgi:AI-2E family transporter
MLTIGPLGTTAASHRAASDPCHRQSMGVTPSSMIKVPATGQCKGSPSAIPSRRQRPPPNTGPVRRRKTAVFRLLTFDPLWQALLPAGIYLLIHLVEGEAITPMLLARQLTLNPVVVIIALVFWYWMWGVAGALLAVPMLATFKIVCDRVQSLAAIGHFLGSEAREMQAAP